VSGESLAGIADARALLLDFDGPVCSIFAGLPAPAVAAELVALLRSAAVTVPSAVGNEGDPLAVLRWTGEACSLEITTAMEDALCAAELQAVGTAQPTPFGHEVIVNAQASGLPLAVVSNNSAGAIEAYLATHDLAGCAGPVIGRAYADPSQMKPNPAPILDAVQALGASPADCVLIGDSLSDIEGARAAGVQVIGYANRPWKVEAFGSADAVVTSMEDIASALRR